jgi:VNT family MFS transporter (synaptic vesicle glycoprotein 2)
LHTGNKKRTFQQSLRQKNKVAHRFYFINFFIESYSPETPVFVVNSATMNLVLSCIFGAVSTMGFNSLDCLGTSS